MVSFFIKIENPKVVQGRLGHSSISITMDLYSHLGDDLKQKPENDLSKFLNENNDTIKERKNLVLYI